jgi:hypothetical protein
MSAAVILQIIAGIGGIVSLWLRDYYSQEKKAARKEEAEHEASQDLRKAVADRDIEFLASRIDRLRGKD